MKRFLIILFASFVCMMASADNKDAIDLACLKGQNMINFEVDWSNLTINNLSVEDWAAYRKVFQPEGDAIDGFEKGLKPQIIELIGPINKKLEKFSLVLVKKEGCKYTLFIRPLNFDEKGNNKLECLVIDNETQKTIADFIVNGKGGRIGDMGNLWGDGFEDSGEKIGNILSKSIDSEAAKFSFKIKKTYDDSKPIRQKFAKDVKGIFKKDSIKEKQIMNFEVDWSNLTIKDLPVDYWVVYRQTLLPEKDAADELENELKPQITELTKKINKKLEKKSFELLEGGGCEYTLRICPLAFDENGDNTLLCLVINNETQETIDEFYVKGKGGRGNSLSDLWGNGLKNSGEKIGEILLRTIENLN